jgi:outer membrane lipoprotein carrier protein
MRLIMSTMLAFCLLAGKTVAELDEGRQLIDDFLNTVVTLQGDFEQVMLDADGQVAERTTGTLEILRPGRFRWSYQEPFEQWLVADGLNIWSYDVDLEQVTVKAQREALSNTPALLLGGSANTLEEFDYEGSYVEEATHWVRLHPHDGDSGFARVELGFLEGVLHRMVFFDNLEQTTLIALREVRVNEPIAPERFEFSVPEGVDVVGTPSAAAPKAP